MKGLLRTILLGLFLALSVTVYSQTCYVTKTGSKYHMPSCSYLKYSKIPHELSKATEAGYTACSQCKPTKAKLQAVKQTSPVKVIHTTSAVQCRGKTKAGARCKRRTKNASGFCYQHG